MSCLQKKAVFLPGRTTSVINLVNRVDTGLPPFNVVRVGDKLIRDYSINVPKILRDRQDEVRRLYREMFGSGGGV